MLEFVHDHILLISGGLGRYMSNPGDNMLYLHHKT